MAWPVINRAVRVYFQLQTGFGVTVTTATLLPAGMLYLPRAVQHSATERSLSPLLTPGMLYRIQCHLLRHSLLSDDF